MRELIINVNLIDLANLINLNENHKSSYKIYFNDFDKIIKITAKASLQLRNININKIKIFASIMAI